MSAVLGPAVHPFAVSAAVMLCLVVLEGLSVLAGHSASGLIEHGLEVHPDHDGAADGGALSGSLNWLNVGGVPFLALVIIACAAFSALGFAIQGVATALAGPLPVLVASGAALAGAVPATRLGTRLASGLVPRDETYAVTLDDLVGATARVTLGPIDQGMPGCVSATDRHGNRHSLRAVAATGQPAIPQDARVLLVDLSGQVFTVVPATGDLAH